MHDADQAKIAVAQPMTYEAVRQGLEPDRRQGHDEYGRGADNASKGHHPIGGNFLRESANERNETNNQDAIDRPEPADGSAIPQYADAKLRIDVIHLHEDQLQEGDQDEEGQKPVNPALPPEPDEEPGRLRHAVAHHSPHRIPRVSLPLPGGQRSDYHTLIGNLNSHAQKVKDRQYRDFNDQANQEQGPIGADLHAEQRQRKVPMLPQALPHKVEEQSGDQEPDVHHHVEDRERDRALAGTGVAADGGNQHRRAQRLTDRQREQPACQRQPLQTRERHHGASDDADPYSQEEGLAQPDGIRQRADQQSDRRHQERPRGNQTKRVLVAVA